MEPVSLIVAACAFGASAAASSTIDAVVQDAYQGLKDLIKKKSKKPITFEGLESNPNSELKRASLAEDLTLNHIDSDYDILEKAKQLVQITRQLASHTQVNGVKIQEVEAEFIKIQEVRSSGNGVNIQNTKVVEGIEISKVTAGKDPRNP